MYVLIILSERHTLKEQKKKSLFTFCTNLVNQNTNVYAGNSLVKCKKQNEKQEMTDWSIVEGCFAKCESR